MANPPKLSKAEKTANYEALKLKEKAMALSQKENISYESALEIVSKLANETDEAIKEIKDQKRTAKTNAKNRKKKLKKEQVNKNSWLSKKGLAPA